MGFFARLFGAPSQEELDAQDEQLRAVEANYRDRQQARLDAQDEFYAQNGFGPDYDAQRALDARNRAVDQHLADSHIDVEDSIGSEFRAGLQEGAGNVTSALRIPFDVLGEASGAILKSIPWWVWLGLAAFLFLQFGGLRLLAKFRK